MSESLHIHKIDSLVPKKTTVFFLHGIMGRGRNWQGFAEALVRNKPDHEAVLVDLRLHGASQGFEPPHTVAACAEDVIRLMKDYGDGEKILVGHSFGGKVSLAVVKTSTIPVKQVWLVDSFPGLSVRHGEVWKMMAWLRQSPQTFSSRQEAEEMLRAQRFSDVVRRWMVTNLKAEGDGFQWVFPVEGISALIEDYARTDLTETLLDPPCPVHLVKGTKSPLITDDLIQRMNHSTSPFPIFLHLVEAGHWVQSENPKALWEAMKEYF